FHQVHDGGVHAALGQAVGGFETEQAAADHHRLAAVLLGRRNHGADVVEVAEGDHALQVRAGQGQADGVGAIGQDQDVVGDLEAPLGAHDLGGGVDGGDRAAGVKRDAV